MICFFFRINKDNWIGCSVCWKQIFSRNHRVNFIYFIALSICPPPNFAKLALVFSLILENNKKNAMQCSHLMVSFSTIIWMRFGDGKLRANSAALLWSNGKQI